jgi:hypothetical protein
MMHTHVVMNSVTDSRLTIFEDSYMNIEMNDSSHNGTDVVVSQECDHNIHLLPLKL